MKQNRCVLRKPVQELTAEPSIPEYREKPLRRFAPHWCCTCRDNAEFADSTIAAGLSAEQSGPLTHEVQADDGRTVIEELTLVGTVQAPAEARECLERAGIDLRYARHRPDEQRWVRCLFSDSGTDRLREQMAQGKFPYAFQATSSLGAGAIQAQRAGQTEAREIAQFWFITADLGRKAIQGSMLPQSALSIALPDQGAHPARGDYDDIPMRESAVGRRGSSVVTGGAQS